VSLQRQTKKKENMEFLKAMKEMMDAYLAGIKADREERKAEMKAMQEKAGANQ
jgi:hypothetical protein